METIRQSIHKQRCSDGNCIFAMPEIPKGMVTNGGCQCLKTIKPHELSMKVNRLSQAYKQCDLTAAQAEITRLQSALDVAVEALSSMHIDTPMGWDLDNPENVTYEIAIGWHKSNNEKTESALDKIKQIKNSTQ